MVRDKNGYVTISVGIAGEQRKPPQRKQSETVRNRQIRRLRREGWSYRHISAAMNMSYASVCDLLDGAEAHLTPLPLPPRVTTRSRPQKFGAPEDTDSPASDGRYEQLTAQISIIQRRLDKVITLQEAIRKRLGRLEKNFLGALKHEHHELGLNLQNNLKTLLERVLPRTSHKDTDHHG